MAKKEIFDVEILRKVAKWHHDDFLKKTVMRERLEAEYARKFDDRSIDRILLQAVERGVLKISYPSVLPDSTVAEALRRKYEHLIKVITVPYDEETDHYENMVAQWSHAAARYFDEIVSASNPAKPLHVGISGGETLMAFAEAIKERERPNVHVHALALLGRGEEQSPDAQLLKDAADEKVPTHVDPLVNAQILFGKCGKIPGHIHFATVPPLGTHDRAEIYTELNELVKRPAISNAVKWMSSVSVAFVGLGMIRADLRRERANQLSMTGLVAPIVSPHQLQKEKAAGDLAYNFFDRDGNNLENARFFLTAGWFDKTRQGVDFYRRMVDDRTGKVIVIAGQDKQAALQAALKGRLFNCLITDSATAEDMLEA